MVHEKTLAKKHIHYLIPSPRYQDFWQLLQNPKVLKIVLGLSNHAQRFTPPYYLDVENPLNKKLMSLFSCLFSCSVGVPRSYIFFSPILTSIVTIFTLISSPSGGTYLLNSSLFELLIFMLVLSSVLDDFLSGIFFLQIYPNAVLLCVFFSLCLLSNGK